MKPSLNKSRGSGPVIDSKSVLSILVDLLYDEVFRTLKTLLIYLAVAV